MKVYTLMEDSSRKNSGFLSEHGLSLYFEHHGKRILFDTGASDSFIYNATLLGIDLAKVDICVISHAHDDHTGGLAHFLDINRKAKVYMNSTATGDYYIKRLFKKEKCGVDSSLFEKYADRIAFLDEDTEIADGVIAVNINKYRHYPLYSTIMYEKRDDVLIRDSLLHELFIAVKTKAGIVVFTGCAHHGLINILMTANEKFGNVSGVIGGFHLDGIKKLGIRTRCEPQIEIRAIAKYLNKNKIKKIYTGHCTGEKPFEKLELLSRAKKMHAGDIIKLS